MDGADSGSFVIFRSSLRFRSTARPHNPPGTRVCFRLGDFDAKKLEDGFSAFDAKDLQNLGVGEAIARIERMEFDFNLRTSLPPQIDAEAWRQRKEKITSLLSGSPCLL